MTPAPKTAPPVTRGQLIEALRAARVNPGATLMVHTRMSSLGLVIGGADTVVNALLETLGPAGTLMVYTSWEHDAYDIDDWSEERRSAYLRDPPVFDARVSEAWTGVGRIPERVRTWPGARRSAHPLASVAAVGRGATALTRDHRLGDGYGATSPFARLVARRGQVLMLGAPLNTLTILHHAEAIADIGAKRRRRCPTRLQTPAGIVDANVDDIDTLLGAYDYSAAVAPNVDAFAAIAGAALNAGVGRRVQIAAAASHLFDAAALVAFAVGWLEKHALPVTATPTVTAPPTPTAP